jgi:septal ring factor EnvC (AmiA/AmiB activator)
MANILDPTKVQETASRRRREPPDRLQAALKAAGDKSRRLEQQLAGRDTRIKQLEELVAALERQVEHLDTQLMLSESGREADDTEIGEHFRALVTGLDDHFISIRCFPIGLQLQLEDLCTRFGAACTS